MHTTPPSLLERLREPAADQAWERFVELYMPLLVFWARRLGLQESDAADLVQDVFTVLLEKLPDFEYDRQKSFRGWLRTIVVNKCRERQRRNVHEAGTGIDWSRLPDDRDPDAQWEAEYRRRLVGRAMQLMARDFQPASWKACWELVVVGRPAKAVAGELKMQVGAVYAAKCRVLARLRQELEGLLE